MRVRSIEGLGGVARLQPVMGYSASTMRVSIPLKQPPQLNFYVGEAKRRLFCAIMRGGPLKQLLVPCNRTLQARLVIPHTRARPRSVHSGQFWRRRRTNHVIRTMRVRPIGSSVGASLMKIRYSAIPRVRSTEAYWWREGNITIWSYSGQWECGSIEAFSCR